MKKAFSKSLSWLLSVVMIFGVFIVPTSIHVSATQSRKDYFNKNYSVVSGDPGQTIVNIAKAQIGKTGNDLPYGEDWCADFVSDCADLAGQSAAVPRRGNVDDLTYAVIKIGGGKQYWNESEAKPGDLVFYDGSDMNGSPNHVEIVAYVSGGKIYSIGGNTGNIYSCYNSVVSNVRQYYPTNRFLYFIRPNYKNTNIDVKVDVGTNFYAQIIHDGKALTQINDNVVLSTTTGTQNQLWYFERTDGLYYKITNVGNFKVLDAAGQGTANGTNVGTYESNDTDAQRWYFVKSGGNLTIVPKYSSNIAVDLNSGNMADGTNIQLWERNGSFAQAYVIITPTYNDTKIDVGTNFYAMICHNGKVLAESNGNVVLATETRADQQMWYFEKDSNLNYKITNVKSKKCLDVAGGGTTYGTNVGTYESNNTDAQRWYFVKSGGNLIIVPKLSSNIALDLCGGMEDGSNIQIWGRNGTFAQEYVLITPTYTVSYDMNGGSGSISNQTKTYGKDLTLSSTKPTRTGYNFLGWNTNKSATTAQYQAGGKYTVNSGATLYAIWKINTWTVSYNMNGGSGSIANQTKTYGQDLTLSGTKPTRTGYEFVGWNTNASATSAQYSAGGKYTANSGATLYAIWREIGHVMSESEAAGRTIPDGDYYIVSEINPNYFIDIPGNDFNTTSGKNVQMWIWSSMPPREGYDCFHFEYLNNGFYKITQINTNMCIDVANASMYKGANVQMCVDNKNNAQQWSIEKTSHGYRIRSKCNGYYLDVVDGKHESGTNVRVWTGNDSKAQSFSFIPRNLDEKPISDGVYTIKTNVNKECYLDVYGSPGEFKVGSNVQLYKFNNAGVAEKYTIKYAGDGWYKIFEKTSGLIVEFVDINTNFLNNSKNVQLANDNGGKNQLWKMRKNSDGTYFIINKANGYYLDLENSKTDNGANVSQCTYNGSNAQKWIIELETYTISYNMNGGSGSIASQTKIYGQDLILSSTKPTRTGYEFVGWNSHANATTAEFQPNWKYVNNYGIVLYAIWKPNTYTVSYNVNGGSGSIGNQTKTYGQDLTLSSTKPTRTGYNFLGWNTNKSATTAQYQPSEKYTANSGATLYAVWKKLAENTPQIIVENKTASAGSEVKVNVSLKNNPGISSMGLNLKYDKTKLTLKAVNYNSAMGGQSMQPQTMDSPVILNWVSPVADYSGDGTYAELVFKVSDKAKSGTVSIEITYDSNNVYNLNDENIAFEVKNGTVTVSDYIPGDINNDGVVNNKDFSRLFQYLSGWNVVINEAALDVNGDGSVNNKDATRLFQYVSGWNVNIY